MKIYLDIFFLVNTAVNFVVLMAESFFQKRRIRLIRLLAASLLGGFLAIVFLVSGIHKYIVLSAVLYGAGCAVLVRTAFGKTTVRSWMKNFVLYYLSSFFLSGILQYLQGVFRIQGCLFFVLLVSGGCLYLLYRFLPYIRKYEERDAAYIPVRLSHRGKKVQGKGLLDTGNHLTEPFSGEPVIIGEMDFISPLFEREIPLFRYIPFHAIGTESGTLRAFQAEYLEMQSADGIWKRKDKPWIAIYENRISADGEYEMILHPDIVDHLCLCAARHRADSRGQRRNEE